MQTFYKSINGETVSITLYSLAEYESDGGIYDDSGNGGEDMSEHKSRFVCAAAVTGNETGLPDNDVLEMVGLAQNQYWLDDATGYFLLYDWPTDAPLEARAGVS